MIPTPRRIALLAIVLAATALPWLVQPRAQTRNDNVLPALLVEVKGLRAAMEQMASVNAQSQLLVGRLQLQEGRINGTVRRLDTVRDALRDARGDLEEAQRTLKMLESPDKKPEGLAAIATMFLKPEDAERAVASQQARVTRLEQEEAQLTQQIAVDQATWTDISRRLEELERSLVKR